MKYRIETLLASEAADTAATKTIDINLAKPISRLTVEFKGTNNNSVPTAHGAKMISKMELVDGSDVIYSLSGIESQALTFYERGEMPFAVHEYRNDVSNIQTFDISFGRFLWDTELALDPSRFKNLQLKITHDKALGGSTPDAGNLRVFAYLFDKKLVTPRGFLMSKEWFTYSLTSSAVQRVDLPTDYPYRILMIQSLFGGKQPWEQYNKLKLSLDGGASVPINALQTSDLLKLMHPRDRIVESVIGIGTGSAQDLFVTAAYDNYAVANNFDAAATEQRLAQDYGGTLSSLMDSTEAFQVITNGLAPHGALALQLWDKDDMNDWFQAQNYGSVQMDITAGSAVGSASTCELVVQQLRNY